MPYTVGSKAYNNTCSSFGKIFMKLYGSAVDTENIFFISVKAIFPFPVQISFYRHEICLRS